VNLNQLRYLLAIADCGLNITVAAERVHATQPGLSKQLKQLEEELGFAVFTRKGKSLDAITPDGLKVIEHSRRALAEIGEIRALGAARRDVNAPVTLRLATTHTQARFVLPPAVAQLKLRHPELRFDLEPADTAAALASLAAGRVDLAVISTVGPAPDGMIGLPAYRWRRAVVVPKQHALAALRRAPTLAELAQYPLVSYETALAPSSSLQKAFADAGLVPRIACRASDADLIKVYARAGLGVGILAEMALGPADREGLVVLDPPPELPPCTTWVVMRPGTVPPAAAVDFVTLLAPRFPRDAVLATLNDPALAPSAEGAPWWDGPPVAATT